MASRFAQDLKDTYAEISKQYAQSHGDDLEVDLLNQFLKLVPTQSQILDLGAGLGRDSAYFIDKGWNVTLFDLSPELLTLAKQRVPKATAVEGDMTELPFAQRTFGGIWASMSLLHLPKDEIGSVLDKILSILLPHGIFMCKMRSGEGEKIIESNKYGKPMKRFFAFYTESEFVRLIKDHGFTIIDHFLLQQDTPEKTIVVVATKS